MAQVDIQSIKENLRFLLETANTTTASPVDLSNNMTDRVQKVLRVNPSRIPLQASFFPYVTVYADSKEMKQQTIAVNNANAVRQATLRMKIIGAVQNWTIDNSFEQDEGDDDIEILMENIEEIIRNNETFSNTVTWKAPEKVTYYDTDLDEGTSIRVAVMELRAEIYY